MTLSTHPLPLPGTREVHHMTITYSHMTSHMTHWDAVYKCAGMGLCSRHNGLFLVHRRMELTKEVKTETLGCYLCCSNQQITAGTYPVESTELPSLLSTDLRPNSKSGRE